MNRTTDFRDGVANLLLRERKTLDGLTFHGLHHSAATHWIAEGLMLERCSIFSATPTLGWY